MVKHRTLSPECPFVVSPLECGNVPILRRESSAFSQAQVDYRIESERLASYRGWSSPHVAPEALARNGLYYLREDDKVCFWFNQNVCFLQLCRWDFQVACAFCSVQLFNWKAGDDPLLEHRKFSPNCPLLMGYLVGNVALDESGSGALIDHGEDDDNYEIVSTTSEESDVTGIIESEQVVIHPFSGIIKTVDWINLFYWVLTVGPDDLTAGNVGNVQLANNPRFGAVAHRPPIHPSYQTIQSRLASFTGWPRESPSANTLAAAGFFYQGIIFCLFLHFVILLFFFFRIPALKSIMVYYSSYINFYSSEPSIQFDHHSNCNFFCKAVLKTSVIICYCIVLS